MKKTLLALLLAVCPCTAAESAMGLAAIGPYATTLTGERRAAADFLIENLPAADRNSLPREVLRENLEQAFVARAGYPWTKELPQDLFFNEVLPHLLATETRDAWRKTLRERFHPLLKGCRTLRDASAVIAVIADKETPVRLAVTEADAGGLFSIDQRKALASWFRSGGAAWPALDWPAMTDAATTARAREELWPIFRDARRLDPATRELGPLPPLLAELEAQAVDGKMPLRPGNLTLGQHSMPFVLLRKESAAVPAAGRALYICMHGGGCEPGAKGPHEWQINTREWMAQASLAGKTYPGEGIYFVPRMADDRLGRWHHALNQDAFDRVIEHGIREWGVDPDRVFILGISEGCYGTQILGPFMADRFAAASAMAGGVGDDVPAENLRNLPFRTDVGEKDTTFDRVGLARSFHARMDEAAKSVGGYPNFLNVQAGRGHGLDYQPGPAWMIQHHRKPRPDTVVWTSKVHDGRRRPAFYWLGLEVKPPTDRVVKLTATLKDQTLDLSALDAQGAPITGARVTVMLDDALIELSRPLAVRCNGKDLGTRILTRSLETLARSLVVRGDPSFAFPASTVIDL